MVKNFLNISSLTKEQLTYIIENEDEKKILTNKNLGLLFEKHSTRTRLSFITGILDLGGNAIEIRFEDLNISREESFEDTFRAMNCYLDGLIFRTNNHQKLIDASQYFNKPIINALSDLSHPCQIISDLLTLKEHFGSFAFHILWAGDMNNVCFSLVESINLLENIKLTICTPSSISNKIKWPLSKNIIIVDKFDDIDLSQVNCVMTDVFISMNDDVCADKIALLKPYCVTTSLMRKTSANSVFMHCLPAKVGYEVSEEVFRSSKSIVWRQAYNRMIAQKRLLNFIYQ